ncbi:MAG: hypothetical protein HYZ28_27015 [Myxococcales bacterium]|nr:hypothetical protein [Myxococcales bacterium]
MQLSPRARADAIVGSEDARALVRSVPEHDLYTTIVDVGLEDASELVQIASPEQFRAFVDLASWRKDKLDPLEVLAWLRVARGDDRQQYLAKLRRVDLEVLELVFRALTHLHDLEENPDVKPEGVAFQTAEGKYLMELRVEGSDMVTLRHLAEDLIAESPFEASRLFEAVRWELPSELEEAAYRFRTARLADLGFPEHDEAMKLYGRVDPKDFAPAGSARSESVAAGGGVALRAPEAQVDFVEAAFRGLDSEEREGLEQEVRYLVNCALVAEGAEPGDARAVRRVSEMARDYLALALEHMCGADPSQASACVREHDLRRIFQVGFSLTLELKHRADRLASEPMALFEGSWLLFDGEAAALAALRRRRPARALKVEGAEPVTFRSRRELAEAYATLERAEGQREVFSELFGSSPEDAARTAARFAQPFAQLGAERVFHAAVATAVLDAEAEARPVPEVRLVELCERLFEGSPDSPRLREGARSRAQEAFASRLPPKALAPLEAMLDRSLEKLRSEMARPFLKERRVDPKSVPSLPTAPAPVR